MIPLKEDGSLDMESIKSLSYEEYLKMLGRLSYAQLQEYISKLPLNENNLPMHAVKVDYGLDDLRSGIDFDEFIDKKKKKYGIQ